MKPVRLKCSDENIKELIKAAIHQLKYLLIIFVRCFLQINSSNAGLNNTAYMYIIGVLMSDLVVVFKKNIDDNAVRTLNPIIEIQNE